MLFSMPTLELEDVGNFWWLGIRNIESIVPNSTVQDAAFWVSGLTDRNSNLDAADTRQSNLAVMPNLGTNFVSDEDTITLDGSNVGKAWWSVGASNNNLITVNSNGEDYSLTISGKSFEPRISYDTSDSAVAFGQSCTLDDGKIIVGGLKDLYYFGESTVRSERLGNGDLSNAYQLTDVQAGCIGIAANFSASESDVPEKVDLALVDIAFNQVRSTFSSSRFVIRQLINQGSEMIEQKLEARELANGGYRMTPTGEFRIVETNRGSEKIARKLPVTGSLVKYSCDAGSGQAGLFRFLCQREVA